MRTRGARGDERAVSPVIAVILMVAVTVILSAVIGTFVLGIGSQVTSTTPKVAADFVYSGSPSLQIIHRGGDPVPEAALTVTVDGTGYTCSDGKLNCPFSKSNGGDGKYEAGDIIEFTGSLSSEAKIKVVWQNPDGDGTAIIAEDTAPQ